MRIGETYERHVRSIEDGTVRTWDGRPVYFYALIRRRWGWPKKAALAAAAFIKQMAEAQGRPVLLWVQNPERTQQQEILFAGIPDLRDMLCAGLANGSSKEAEDCDSLVVGVNVAFTRAVDDDGLVNGITHALAARFGCAPDNMREAVTYNTGSPLVTMRVDVDRFTAEPNTPGCVKCMSAEGHFPGCPEVKP
jgi:hypothetical protein